MKKPPNPITDRFGKVLDEVYGGDTFKMAGALGIDRSSCSRYKHGRVIPTRRTLASLASIAHISLEWLEHGGSDVIQFEELSSANAIDEFGLPVFSAPLETKPSEQSPGRLGMNLVAIPPYFSEGRYWLKIGRGIEAASVVVGDYVLLETCEPRPANESDDSRIRVIRRGDAVVFDVVTNRDIEKRSKVLGAPVLLQRDL